LAAHRAELRRRRLRPIQIWVPDTRAPCFAEDARRQAKLVAAEEDFDDTMDFIERMSEFDEIDDPADDTSRCGCRYRRPNGWRPWRQAAASAGGAV
jgi:hypothetical protein